MYPRSVEAAKFGRISKASKHVTGRQFFSDIVEFPAFLQHLSGYILEEAQLDPFVADALFFPRCLQYRLLVHIA